MTTTLKRTRFAERLAAKHVSAAPPKCGRPPMAFFYVRFSTAEQSKGTSYEHQMEAIERVYQFDYADQFAKAPVVYLDAGISAFKVSLAKREAGAKLLADVQAGDVILAYKGDRLFRSLEDTIGTMKFLEARGVRLRLADGQMATDYGTAAGRLTMNILGAVSQYDSELKGERVSAALKIAIQNGSHCGPPPAFIEKVTYRTRKRWVIKKPYVDALDFMAKEIREKTMSVDRLLKETRKRMAAADDEFVPQKHYGLSRTQFYDSVKPRFANWSKETGRTIEHIPPFQSESTKRWLYPQMPVQEEA